LTANADESHFNKAKAINMYEFITKPFKKLDLQRAIELAIIRFGEEDALGRNVEKIRNQIKKG